MITQAMVDQLKEDIDTWYNDYTSADGQSENNEWYLQLESVLNAAYGVGNWEKGYIREILFPTGFPIIDNVIGGAKRKQLICIFAGYKDKDRLGY